MAGTGDPFYDRKPVPDAFLDGVGYTGLSATQEHTNRERKFSTDKGDLRKFWNPKEKDGKFDPYYQRKRVSDAEIHNVGDTGLTKEQEFLNRERKFSVNGVDVRKFGDSAKGGFHPADDPYYGRKAIGGAEIDGVGETGASRAEDYESRENKASLFDLSSDPFQQLSGRGHRASVSGIAGIAAQTNERRRSSAVAPHHAAAAAQAQHHSGYDGDNKLAPVISRADEEDRITPSNSGTSHMTGNAGTVGNATNTGTVAYPGNVGNIGNTTNGSSIGNTSTVGTTGTTSNVDHMASRDGTGHVTGDTGHTMFYDRATVDDDDVAPHEIR